MILCAGEKDCDTYTNVCNVLNTYTLPAGIYKMKEKKIEEREIIRDYNDNKEKYHRNTR